jgi:protein-S-isoprenylcysteine O-methyltransferase Ste14
MGVELERPIFAVVLLVNFVIVSTYRRKAQAGQKFSLEEEGALIAVPLRLLALAVLAYIGVYLAAPGLVMWSLVEVPVWLRAAGVFVGLAVVPPLIAWAQRTLGDNVTTTVITREHHELVTTGPYRYVRHPLYVLGLVLYLSLATIIGSWVLGAAVVAAFAIIAVRARKEEAMLIERFGDEYRSYMQRTARFIPRA